MANHEIISEAGAIAFKKDGQDIRILLIRGKKNPSNWIFPKGHIEKGETSPEAAIRELHEEAGVEGVWLRPVGIIRYSIDHMQYAVEYHLVKFKVRSGQGENGREPTWCGIEKAMKLLTFQDMRLLLEKALQNNALLQ